MYDHNTVLHVHVVVKHMKKTVQLVTLLLVIPTVVSDYSHTFNLASI